MRKTVYKILALGLCMTACALSGSCSKDELGPSIFDATEYPLDPNSITFPLDTFCKKNFLEPYNLKYIYRMEDTGSDMSYNLVPCSYDQSVTLAVLCKYLWYDVYHDSIENGELFLKKYSPRIIHVIGSPAFNPAQGTEVLGTAEGGLKITLYNANNLSPDNIDYMNEYFFKTMHHEFSHILNQNANRPNEFDRISNGKYNAVNWNDTEELVALGQGFVSPYASSQAREDWVEVISNYIVKDTITWNEMMENASFQWEYVKDVDAVYWDKLDKKVKNGTADRDSVGFFVRGTSTSGDETSTYGIVRKVIQRDDDNKYAVPDADGNIVYLHTSGIVGDEVIRQKLDMVRTWLAEYFDMDLEKIRMGVQRRQWLTDSNGDFVFDSDGKFINNLTYVRADGTSVMDSLRQEVLKFSK